MKDDPCLTGFWRGLALARDGLEPLHPNPYRARDAEWLEYNQGFAIGRRLGAAQRKEALTVAEVVRRGQAP